MRKWYPWLIVALAIAFSAAVFNRLPQRIAIHWSTTGEVNGTAGRVSGAFLLPFMLVMAALIIPRLPLFDPKRENYAKFRPTYDLVFNGVITVLAALHVLTLGVALGWPIAMDRVTPVLVGGLLILLGNVMPRARPNWMFGIRTPWTLTNDRVWERTHRLGGYLFVGAGIVVLLLAAAPPAVVAPALMTAVGVAAIVPLVYSYFAWKQETSR